MGKPTKLGTAGTTLLRKRTGAEALAVATTPATAGARALDDFKVTTIRFTSGQWMWLRRQALERALDSGTRADASEVVRELVANAMPKGKGAGR